MNYALPSPLVEHLLVIDKNGLMEDLTFNGITSDTIVYADIGTHLAGNKLFIR